MLRTACFFGFLWLSARGRSYSTIQFVPAVESSVHLTVIDVAADSLLNPSLMRVRLVQSKNGPVPAGCGYPTREDGYRFMSCYGNAGLPRLARSRGKRVVSVL